LAYRRDLDVWLGREKELEADLAALRAKEAELAALKAGEAQLLASLAEVRAKLEPWRGKALRDALVRERSSDEGLDDIQIASPCTASWDDMVGDERRRFCDACGHNVYNASAMTRAELGELVKSQSLDRVCLRLYRREDGTLMTTDCPVGKRRVRLRQAVAVACSSVLAGVAVAAVVHELSRPKLDELYTVHYEPATHHRLAPPLESTLGTGLPEGARAAAPPPPPTATPPKHAPALHHTMGILRQPHRRGSGSASCTSNPGGEKTDL
jgi:hypothetical protein